MKSYIRQYHLQERRLSYEGENRFWRRLGGSPAGQGEFEQSQCWVILVNGNSSEPSGSHFWMLWHATAIYYIAKCQDASTCCNVDSRISLTPALIPTFTFLPRQGEYEGGSRLRLLRQDALTRHFHTFCVELCEIMWNSRQGFLLRYQYPLIIVRAL